ncbi:outer membrane lipoprotein chaperone LolA [Candidatus Vallotiella sp. (ex Adelges kitamiensis)]|uniref:outer membrane lipoprotein chaperone LolA n=1 Tax=Candidatus Vallotiella sp. (ex Adelges kitamiensis) TaxID=2864217 RepID=UPI001CE39F80|nr:outer membrane lipoprotein chaperone LolA [Candidatus Vallotia sp. (ex Adelges kitamiensis)]
MIGLLLASIARIATGVLINLVAMPFVHAGGTIQFKNFVSQLHSADGEFVQHQIKATDGSASQELRQPVRTSMSTSSGTFQFIRPGKFIWAYQKPYKQLLHSDGHTLYIWDKDLNQVITLSLSNALGTSPAAILFGSDKLEKNFSLHDTGVKQSCDWLKLIPKEKNTQFEYIDIGFQDGNLKMMELHDVFGNITLLSFSNIHKNPELSADTFKFLMPQGVDIINN